MPRDPNHLKNACFTFILRKESQEKSYIRLLTRKLFW